MVTKINLKLLDYPILDDSNEINIAPYDIFRLEGVPFFHPEGEYFGSVLLMFTGLMAKDEGSEFLHCVPISFYGSNDQNLSKLYKGQDLWVEIVSQVSTPRVPQGYWN